MLTVATKLLRFSVGVVLITLLLGIASIAEAGDVGASFRVTPSLSTEAIRPLAGLRSAFG